MARKILGTNAAGAAWLGAFVFFGVAAGLIVYIAMT